jgi:phosphomannomutase
MQCREIRRYQKSFYLNIVYERIGNVEMENLMKLQNGSDIRGIACEGIAGENVNFTPEIGNRIGQAFVIWLQEKFGQSGKTLKIGVGHDSRITADSLLEGIAQGIMSKNAEVFDCGLVSTPSMFMTTIYPETNYDGAIMITASHLPFNRNGMKFFTKDGGLDKADITYLLKTASALECQSSDLKPEKVDSLSLYCADLRKKICDGVQAENYDKPLVGMHVVVDTGNGAGGFFATAVLEPLGADISGSQFLEPDGYFPNHIPNPEDKQAMESICKAVIENHADLGIIFDTDVDRMSAVLPNGKPVNRDVIIAMMSAIIAEDYPGGTIITDSVTSDLLTDFLENHLGLKHHCFRRGYKNLINEGIRLNAEGVCAPAAIETSGHGALRENYFLDDGSYMAVKLLIAEAKLRKSGKGVSDLIADLKSADEAREHRMHITCEDYAEYGNKVLEQFRARAKEQGLKMPAESYEGVRLQFSGDEIQGWALLRMSLHEPLMPLNIEGTRSGDCDKIQAIVKKLLEGFEELDMSML